MRALQSEVTESEATHLPPACGAYENENTGVRQAERELGQRARQYYSRTALHLHTTVVHCTCTCTAVDVQVQRARTTRTSTLVRAVRRREVRFEVR